MSLHAQMAMHLPPRGHLLKVQLYHPLAPMMPLAQTTARVDERFCYSSQSQPMVRPGLFQNKLGVLIACRWQAAPEEIFAALRRALPACGDVAVVAAAFVQARHRPVATVFMQARHRPTCGRTCALAMCCLTHILTCVCRHGPERRTMGSNGAVAGTSAYGRS